MTRLLLIATAVAVLAGCAAPPPAPVPIEPNCAIAPEKGTTDGGLGGTGKAPEDCPPAQ